MGAHFNSNMLIGILMIVVGIATIISIVVNRYKTTQFKGRLPVIIISIVVSVIGLVLLIMGICYEWPNLIASSQTLLNPTSFL